MKKSLLTFFLLFFIFCLRSFGQGLSVNTSGNSPDVSAILDVSSSVQGLLIPRMATANIAAISNPAKGLLVLDSSLNQLMQNIGTPAAPIWVTISYSSGWNLTGNNGTNPANNFLGTTDSTDMIFRVNNQNAGKLNAAGNIFWGLGSGSANTTGLYNVGIGKNSLHSNTISYYQVAVGEGALYNNGKGASTNYASAYNTAVGDFAMYKHTNGVNNTALGFYSLYNDSIGAWNTAVGAYALESSVNSIENTAFGIYTLAKCTTGYINTAIGDQALYSDTSGYSNTAVGHAAMWSNTNGFENTAVGDGALTANTTGQYNTGIGAGAIQSNQSGNYNTAIGGGALKSNISGNQNTSVGLNAAYNFTAGISNVSIGDAANWNLTTGSYNLTIGGYFSGMAPGTGYYNNTTSINNGGTNPYLNAYQNQVFIGNLDVGWIGGNVTWSTYSDERIKTNIVENVQGLSFIQKLKPVTYNLDSRKQAELTGNKIAPDRTEKSEIEKMTLSGFLAQDVEKAAIACGYNFSGVRAPNEGNKLYTLSYEQFVVPLVKGMQEQQTMIDDLKKQNALLLQRIEKLEKH